MKRLLTVIVCVCWPGLVGCDQAKSVVRKALKNAAPEESEVGQVLVLDASTYEEFEQQQRRLVVVDFYADWCASCRQLEPILGRVTADFAGKAVVGKVNIAKEKQIAIDRGDWRAARYSVLPGWQAGGSNGRPGNRAGIAKTVRTVYRQHQSGPVGCGIRRESEGGTEATKRGLAAAGNGTSEGR